MITCIPCPRNIRQIFNVIDSINSTFALKTYHVSFVDCNAGASSINLTGALFV